MGRPKIALMMLILGSVAAWAASAMAGSVTPPPERLAQAPAAPPPAAPQPAGPGTPQGADNSIGGVATLQGAASVTRNNATSALKLRDGILKGDVLQTSVTGTLGITFDDETTFTLTPHSRIAVDDFVYQEGGTHNAAVFNVLRGTVAFVASEVAKTGSMKIDTPTATLGIRGTSGVVDVPEGATAGGTAQVGIKLYPDADGRVGRIEVFGRDGAQLGILNRGATGFAIRPGLPGAPQRFSAVPLQISAQEAARDRSFVRQAVSSQRVGRQINIERRNLRQNNPRPNQPRPNLRQPGQQTAPGRERRPELQPQPGQPGPGRQAGGGPQRSGPGGPPRPPAPPKKPPPKGKNQSR
jgi:FecR protein